MEQPSVVARGDVDGVGWTLQWSEDLHHHSGLMFLSDGEFGVLSPTMPGEVGFAANTVNGVRVGWGLVDAGTAVRLRDEGGVEHDAALVGGADLGGRAAFVVELPLDAHPVEVVGVGAIVPPVTDRAKVAERIDVFAVHRVDVPELGTVVGEGRVDDASWTLTISVDHGELHHEFMIRSPTGGGGGSGGGPVPVPTPGRRLRITGTGSSGEGWHVGGWADPSVATVDLRLATGEVLTIPTLGRELDVGFVVWEVALPADARVVVADGRAADGTLVERAYFAGHTSWIEQVMAERAERAARAKAPPPDEVTGLWRVVVGDVDGEVDVPVLVDDMFDRWPIRPLLLTPAGAGQWRIVASRRRWPLGQHVVLGVRCDLDDGRLQLHQGISWVEPPGERDEPNTTVRGLPAHLGEYTMAVNNIDEILLTWEESPSSISPFGGVFANIRADSQALSVAEVRALAESLIRVD